MMRGGIAEAIAGGIAIALLAVLPGCGTTFGKAKDQVKTPDAETKAIDNETATADSTRPRMITNLSQLKAPPSVSSADSAQGLLTGAAALHGGTPLSNDEQNMADRNLDRVYRSKQRSLVHGGETKAAGDSTLLNARARQFADFSYALLNQILVAAQDLETKRLDQKKLPDEIKPVIVIATMTAQGKLTDLGIVQHSGVGSVDRLLIDACKQGIWARNPPTGALAEDGMYKMRVEAVVKNNSFDRDGNYSYVTHVGLALM